MKAKKEYLLLVLVIIALSCYLFFRNPNITHYEVPDIPDIAGKEITKIEILKEKGATVLNKKDKQWYLSPEGYPVDASMVDSMVDVIETFELETLVAEKKSDHLFDLTDDKKMTINIWAGETLRLSFEMGRPAPTWNHTFVRIADDVRVYHAKGNFKAKFDLTIDKLRDKTVLVFEQTEIQGLEISKGEESLILAKDMGTQETPDLETDIKTKDVWKDPTGRQADASMMDTMLSTLSNLKCQNYTDEQDKKSFTKPLYTVKLKGIQEYTLTIFEKPDSENKTYPAISSENDYPFLLSDSQAEKIMKGPDEMMGEKVTGDQ